MKTCLSCNQPIEDTATFCPYCGQKQETVNVSSEPSDEQKKALYVLRRNLRHERKCWTIFGWGYLGIGIFFILYCMGLGLITAGIMGEIEGLGPVTAVGFFFFCILFLPISLINLIMAHKITGYLNTLDTNPNPAINRCGGVWLIILSALFNYIAMIFVILNFIHVKSKKNLLMK